MCYYLDKKITVGICICIKKWWESILMGISVRQRTQHVGMGSHQCSASIQTKYYNSSTYEAAMNPNKIL
jgi:hypothetical protein